MPLLLSRPFGRGSARPTSHRSAQPARKGLVVARGKENKGYSEPWDKSDLSLFGSTVGVAVAYLVLGSMAVSDLKPFEISKMGADIGAKLDKVLEADAEIASANKVFRNFLLEDMNRSL